MIVGGLGCAVPTTTVERFVSRAAGGAGGGATLGVVAQPVLVAALPAATSTSISPRVWARPAATSTG
jgi:hypothetical protein